MLFRSVSQSRYSPAVVVVVTTAGLALEIVEMVLVKGYGAEFRNADVSPYPLPLDDAKGLPVLSTAIGPMIPKSVLYKLSQSLNEIGVTPGVIVGIFFPYNTKASIVLIPTSSEDSKAIAKTSGY